MLLLPAEGEHERSRAAAVAVLAEVDALPGPERRAAVADRQLDAAVSQA
jgi:hypothetical protein